jgi:hypothetical protein
LRGDHRRHSDLVGIAETDVAARAGCDLLRIAEVPEEVFAAARGEARISLDVPDLGVGRLGAVLEPRGDGAAATPVECRSFQPHVHDGAARDDLGRSIDHHPVQRALRDGRPYPGAAGEPRQVDRPAPGQDRVHGSHLLAQTLLLFL